MKTLSKILLVAGGTMLAGLWPAAAAAQKDVYPKLPNVLLLLDNSGSMEYLMDFPGKLPGEVIGSECDGVAHPTVRNRWANLLMALTGDIAASDFQCKAVSRKSAAFRSEYALDTLDPYDYGYYLPFHRVYAGGCGFGAGVLPNNPWKWWNLPSAAGGKDFRYHTLSGGIESAPTSTTCAFSQTQNGALDDFRGLMRFGMMSLDAFPDPGTGSTAAPPTAPDNATEVYTTARPGMWSYFHQWTAAGNPGTPSAPTVGPNQVNMDRPGVGYPSGCTTARFWEVGARNEAAPPWEGRLVPFGDWQTDTNVPTLTDQIQSQVLSMRPFGSSPVAGLLDDAREFLFYDNTKLASSSYRFGPSDDQFWINGCRKSYVILFSDGMANMDLRALPRPCVSGFCQGSTTQTCTTDADCTVSGCDSAAISPGPGINPIPGVCPYDHADVIADSMYKQPPGGNPALSVKTYVIGMTPHDFNALTPKPSVPSAALDCKDLKVGANGNDCGDPTTNPPTYPPAQLYACCNLQKIAVAGGTQAARFVATRQELQQELGKVLSEILQSAGKTDRTWPTFAAAETRSAQGWAASNLPTASYKFAASFKPGLPSAVPSTAIPGTWTGVLERERTSCQGNSPTVQTLDHTKGDDYAYNLDSADITHPRKIFTALGPVETTNINHHTSGTPSIYNDRSLRPFYTGVGVGDGLGTVKPQAAEVPTPASTWVQAMAYDGLGSSNNRLAFGMPAKSVCNDYFGTDVLGSQTTIDQKCTEYLLSWFVGITNPNPLNGKTTFTRHWADCNTGASSTTTKCSSPKGCPCSKMGAIYHSTPVVVGPPREFLRDESYVDYQNNATVRSQPTMLYTATIDGQLHAFKVQSNKTTNVVSSDQLDNTSTNNELWSFVPPFVTEGILGSYNKGGAKLLDGMPVIADIPGTLYTATDIPNLSRAGTASGGWHRVLLASGGSAGGFYYALDITDPENPRFLWQLATDYLGYNLFGATTPTPAIAIVNLNLGGTYQQVAVAILPGGSGVALTKDKNQCDKAHGHEDHHHNTLTSPVGTYCATHSAPHATPCANVKLNDTDNIHLQTTNVTKSPPPLTCWDMKANDDRSTGNSLVIARLDTGEVLGYFLGPKYRGAPVRLNNGHDDDDEGEHGHHHGYGRPTNIYDAPFVSPLTGVPVPYPGQTGQISDRLYVGDADGLLWRMDMSNPDISKWVIELAWDNYVTAPANAAASIREGISIPPIISRDPIGNPVLMVATGDQDSLTSQPSENHVWSFTEMPSTRNTSPNWHIRLAANGPRVTGPMSLFNGSLYFATFQSWDPGSSALSCSDGRGSIWGVDFLRRTTSGGTTGTPLGLDAKVDEWPAGRFPGPSGTPVFGADAGPGSIIMGVSVGQTPTCDSGQTLSGDFGSYVSLTSGGAQQASYQVMWQTGAGAGVSGNQNVTSSSTISNLQSIKAPPLGQGTRIDSWASIVD